VDCHHSHRISSEFLLAVGALLVILSFKHVTCHLTTPETYYVPLLGGDCICIIHACRCICLWHVQS
jgi:hypothetical protein